MKVLHALSILIFLSQPALAFENKTASADFDAASKAASFLRFEIPTKKMGLFKSTVHGYARNFKANARIKGNRLEDARIELEVHGLDTDLYARNDQMWNACLGMKENPVIRVSFPALEFKNGSPVKVVGTISVRGKEKPLPSEITVDKKSGRWVASGKATTSFSDLEIPDPSIGVASVDGPIAIAFQVEDQP